MATKEQDRHADRGDYALATWHSAPNDTKRLPERPYEAGVELIAELVEAHVRRRIEAVGTDDATPEQIAASLWVQVVDRRRQWATS